MNREILFRGQHIDNKQWIYGYYVISRARHEGYEESGCWFLMYVQISDLEEPDHYKVIPETVGQLILHKDDEHNRAKVNFFEGDILKDKDGRVWVLKWINSNAGFHMELQDEVKKKFDGRIGKTHTAAQTYLLWEMEIIGTIHTHPEILKP